MVLHQQVLQVFLPKALCSKCYIATCMLGTLPFLAPLVRVLLCTEPAWKRPRRQQPPSASSFASRFVLQMSGILLHESSGGLCDHDAKDNLAGLGHCWKPWKSTHFPPGHDMWSLHTGLLCTTGQTHFPVHFRRFKNLRFRDVSLAIGSPSDAAHVIFRKSLQHPSNLKNARPELRLEGLRPVFPPLQSADKLPQ